MHTVKPTAAMAPAPKLVATIFDGTLQVVPTQHGRVWVVDLACESILVQFAPAVRGFTRITPTIKKITNVTNLPVLPHTARIRNLFYHKTFGEVVIHTIYGLKNRTRVTDPKLFSPFHI